jgi:hypothetical protein
MSVVDFWFCFFVLFFFFEKEIERKHACALAWKVETFNGTEIFQASAYHIINIY